MVTEKKTLHTVYMCQPIYIFDIETFQKSLCSRVETHCGFHARPYKNRKIFVFVINSFLHSVFRVIKIRCLCRKGKLLINLISFVVRDLFLADEFILYSLLKRKIIRDFLRRFSFFYFEFFVVLRENFLFSPRDEKTYQKENLA